MVFREFSGAILYCVMYKYTSTYTNINILNNTMSFTFIYVENVITWMVSLRCMGIAAAIVSTAVAVIGAGEVSSMTAACIGAALLSHRLTLAVDHVTQLRWRWISLGNSRHRDIIPNLPAEVSDIHRFIRR